MITREIEPELLRLAATYPVLTVTGPRQSGKTTLCRKLFPDHAYRSLEDPDIRAWADKDPRAFIDGHEPGLVIDEAQRVPKLFSYLQTRVDEDRRPGRFIVTGSAQFQLLETVAQSLAGRTALASLLPLTVNELKGAGIKPGLDETLLRGFYPQAYHEGIVPSELLAFYVATYLERDVRQLVNVRDLAQFQTFLRLCAGRTGQILNIASLARDAGVSHPTAQAWLSILETSCVIFFVRPYLANVNKRLTKSPKMHFWDVGLASHLLGIRTADQVTFHPLRGALFESMVVSEMAKQFTNRIRTPHLYHYRDAASNEVDLIAEDGIDLIPIEIKSSKTLPDPRFRGLGAFAKAEPRAAKATVVFGGDESMSLAGIDVRSWRDLSSLLLN